MAKYIKCDSCSKRIAFGADIYKYGSYCGMFCSPECFADAYADIYVLDDDLATDCCCTVFDDDTRKKEIQKAIEDRERDIAMLRKELATLATQN